MSYETFRNDIYCEALKIFDELYVQQFITCVDLIAEHYIIEKACTDLIVYQGTPIEVKDYLACKAVQHVSKGTLQNYYYTLDRFFKDLQRSPKEITSTNIRAWLIRYQQIYKVSNSTLDNKRRQLDNFFEWCVSEGCLERNPCKLVKQIKYQENIREPLTELELATVRVACKDVREKALVEFLYSTGCRIAEVAAIKLSDINIDNHTVIVQHGKGNKKRKTYLNADAIIAIREYLKTRNDDCEYLFVDKRGKNKKHGVRSEALRIEIKKIVERTDITGKTITPHNFRHTTGTQASKSGMPIEEIQQLLGHASIKTTQRYVKVDDDKVRNDHWKYL